MDDLVVRVIRDDGVEMELDVEAVLAALVQIGVVAQRQVTLGQLACLGLQPQALAGVERVGGAARSESS